MPDQDAGRFANAEDDDNSIDVQNEAYVGVDPEYRNAANDTDRPLDSEDKATAALEQRAKDHGQTTTGPHGYTTRTEEKAKASRSRGSSA